MVYGNDESSSTSTSSLAIKTSPSPCSTLMLWANQLKEPNKIDAGMMPPPATTLPLNIRRSSLTGLLSCNSTDQTSPPILKSEIMDESSQNSILSNGAETLNHDSIDTFNNDSSMDGSNSVPEQMSLLNQSPLELIMQKNVALSNAFSPTLNQGLLNLANTSPLSVVDLRVKQEDDIAAQIQELVHPNLGDTTKMLPMNTNESNFLANFNEPKINDLKVQANDVPMFTPAHNSLTTTDQMLSNNFNAISQAVGPVLANDQQIQQTIEQQQSIFASPSLMTEAGTANSLNQILSFPSATQTISTSILATSPPNNSPLSADVMLNSQPVAAMNSSPTMLNVKSGNAASISPIADSDIIMNPTISPSMMCNNSSGDASNLMPNAVTMAEIAPPQQPESLFKNLMQPSTIKQTDAAVKNMILNAAAEILSSEPNSITAETTSNALMSLNPMITGDQASMNTNTPSITNILTNNDSKSSVVVLAGNWTLRRFSHDWLFISNSFNFPFIFCTGNNQLIQNVVAAAAAQNASDIIQNQVVTAEQMQIGSFPIPSKILNVQPTTTAASAAQISLSPAQQCLLSDIQ